MITLNSVFFSKSTNKFYLIEPFDKIEKDISNSSQNSN